MAWLLNWLLNRATFNLFVSPTPIGKKLGGHDIPNITDTYIIITISFSGVISFSGYFQTT